MASLKDLKHLFSHFDANGDNKISVSELETLMRTIGEELSAEDAEALLRYADSDGDGLLDMKELERLVEVENRKLDEESCEEERLVKEAFKLYEMDGKGFITDKSLKRMLSRLGSSRPIEHCRSMISSFDLNGDGVLSFDEFKAMMLL